MDKKTSKNPKLIVLLVLFQVISLLTYYCINIVNVGQKGLGLPVLAMFVAISIFYLLVLFLKNQVYIRIHFIIFILLIAWISLRVIIDLDDLGYLREITIGTTGGMLLFYVLGGLLSLAFEKVIVLGGSRKLLKCLLLFFCISLVWVLYSFFQRIHPTLFIVTGIGGFYQRPGNFLSISFILASFTYYGLVIQSINQSVKKSEFYLWFVVYSLVALMAIVTSQLIGSNSATAVLFGTCLITIVMVLVFRNKKLFRDYMDLKFTLPWSKVLFSELIVKSLFGLLLGIIVLLFLIKISNFDIDRLRVLDFGGGGNSSLSSRFQILMDTGWEQIGFAPLLGNANVAFLVTGISGRTLHSFILYIIANFGMVGLLLVLFLFVSVFYRLMKDTYHFGAPSIISYRQNLYALYSTFILLYILFFACVATGVSWIVLWMILGFISKPFGAKR